MVDKEMAVLAIDDYSKMRQVVRLLLKDLGFYNIDEAASADEAMDKLQEKNYGLIISDWNMPGMTGLELLKRVRDTAAMKDTPFIMISAESKPENILSARDAGVSSYIVKPFTAETLKSRMVGVFGTF